ncbi:MAG: NAD-glutamate dehydrogenase, partial [Actinomycetota bacterium]|nr:NAD-glutamate dehydrogenase [Actinomycetota bacterium]
MVDAATPPVLLIVEDRSDVGAAFAGYFRPYFEAVLVAATPSEAEAMLGASPTPTHVICDYWLGDAFASGGSNGYDHKALAITARGAW